MKWEYLAAALKPSIMGSGATDRPAAVSSRSATDCCQSTESWSVSGGARKFGPMAWTTGQFDKSFDLEPLSVRTSIGGIFNNRTKV